MTTDTTKILTTRQLVLAALKRSIVEGATHARQKRAEGQRCLADARVARVAGDASLAGTLLGRCFAARASANDEADTRRYELLAYGFLRGRNYLEIEPRCAEGNAPHASTIEGILLARFEAVGDRGFTVTEAELKAWIAPAPVEVAQAHREAA